MRLQLFKFAFNNLKARPMRSWLTIIGVIIGIAAVVTFMLLGQGLEASIQEQFQKIGVNKIIIMPGKGIAGLTGGGADMFSEHDLDVIKTARGVEKAGGMGYKMAKVKFRNEIEYTFIIGMPEELTIEEYGFGIEHGRDFIKNDKYKAQVGYDIYNAKFFDKPVKVGNEILIQGTEFEVVGSIEKVGNHADDTQIYIPYSIYQELFDEEGYVMIIAKTPEDADIQEIADAINERLRKDRDLKRGEEDFTVQTFEQMMQTFANILGVVQLVVVGIATISLLVGGIGIMNTMYTSVLERTRQIGVMKAIGAKYTHILTIFVFEAGIIGLVGGAIGVILGTLAGKAVELVATFAGYEILKIGLNIRVILIGLLFAFFIGIISGLAPARQAAKLNPVEALRYE